MTKLWMIGMFEISARRDWVVGINPERRELQIDSGDAPGSYGDQGSSQLKPSWPLSTAPSSSRVPNRSTSSRE